MSQDDEDEDIDSIDDNQQQNQEQQQPASPIEESKPDPYVPKIEFYTDQDFNKLIDAYTQMYKKSDPNSTFVQKFGINLKIQQVNNLIDQAVMDENAVQFFMNILSNEDIIKKELSKGIFLFAIQINLDQIDKADNLSQNDEEEDNDTDLYFIIVNNIQQMLVKDFLIDKQKFIILFIFIEKRWLICLIDLAHQSGLLVDFSSSQNVQLFQVKKVLNQVFQDACSIDLQKYNIETQTYNTLQNPGNCGYYCMNYAYKLIQGNNNPQFSSFTFDKKEQFILKNRVIWIILKLQQQIADPEGYASSLSNRKLPVQPDKLDTQSSKQQQNSKRSDVPQQQQNKITGRSNEDSDKSDNKNNKKKDNQVNKNDNNNNNGRFFPQQWDFSDVSEDDQKQIQYEQDKFLQLQLEELKQKQLQKKLEYGELDDISESDLAYRSLPPNLLQGPPKAPQKKVQQYDELQYLDKGWEIFQPDKFKQEKMFQDYWSFQGPNAVPHYGPNFIGMKKQKKKKMKDDEEQSQPVKSKKQILENKIIDILAALETDPDLIKKLQMERPSVAWLLLQLKNKLQSVEELPDYTLLPTHLDKTQKESEQILNQYLSSGAADDLLKVQEQQRKLAQILQLKEQKFEPDPQLQKVDDKFKQLFGFYDTLNFLENYNKSRFPKRYIALQPKLLDIKQTIHVELQNYLLHGLGLPGNLSKSKKIEVLDETPNGGQFNVGLKNREVMMSQQNGDYDKMYYSQVNNNNHKKVNQQQQLPPLQQQQTMMKNKSEVIFSNKYIQQQNQHERNKSSLQQLYPQWQAENDAALQEKKAAAIRLAERYGITIFQKDLDEVFSQNIVSQKLMNFVIGFLDEKHSNKLNLTQQIERQLRILLMPTKFYHLLTNGNPVSQKINYPAVQDFTARFNGQNKSIFTQIDAVAIPVYFIHHEYALVLIDMNRRFIQYMAIYRNSGNEHYTEQQDIQILENIESYLQYEYRTRYLKGYCAPGFKYNYIQGKNYQVPDTKMTAIYLIHYLRKILRGNRTFDEMLEKDIKFIKAGLKQLVNQIGITRNKQGDIRDFDVIDL